MATQISLDRVVQLGVAATWHEAVAVSQLVGVEARSAVGAAGLDNCLLSTSGAVEVTGPSRTPFVGDPAGAVLRALLDRTRAPHELLALADRSGPPTLAGVSEQLAFFARPDAAALAGELASRALAAAIEAEQRAEIERLRAEASTVAPKVRKPSGGPRPLVRWAVGSAVVVAASAGLAFAVAHITTAADAPSDGSAMAATEAASDEHAQLPVQRITSHVESLVDRGLAALGLTTAAPSEATPNSTTESSSPASARKLPRRAALRTEAAPLVVIMPPATPASAAASNTGVEESDAASSDDAHDNASEGLQPPALKWPQLPNDLDTSSVDVALPYLELLINERGTVDKVRLRTGQTLFHQRMLLAAAKAWVFHPARKDGQPVPYVLKVPIAAP